MRGKSSQVDLLLLSDTRSWRGCSPTCSSTAGPPRPLTQTSTAWRLDIDMAPTWNKPDRAEQRQELRSVVGAERRESGWRHVRGGPGMQGRKFLGWRRGQVGPSCLPRHVQLPGWQDRRGVRAYRCPRRNYPRHSALPPRVAGQRLPAYSACPGEQIRHTRHARFIPGMPPSQHFHTHVAFVQGI